MDYDRDMKSESKLGQNGSAGILEQLGAMDKEIAVVREVLDKTGQNLSPVLSASTPMKSIGEEETGSADTFNYDSEVVSQLLILRARIRNLSLDLSNLNDRIQI